MSAEPPTTQMPTAGSVMTPSQRESNRFDVQRVAAAMAALVVIVAIVVAAFHNDSQGAAAVLGVVIPVITAAIGISIGERSGKAAGEAKAEVATRQDRARIQEVIQPLAASLSARVDEVTDKLEEASTTAPGETDRVISFEPEAGTAASEVRFESDVIDGLRADAAHLEGLVKGLSPQQ